MTNLREWRIFLVVAVFGCIGASVAFAIQATGPIQIVPVWDHPWIQIASQVLIGAFASTIFIFLLSNTDRSDLLRLVCLSMVAGFLWSPVLEVIKKYQIVSKASEQQTANLERQATMIQSAGNTSGELQVQDIDAFIKDYSTWRPILNPSDAVIADHAFKGVASTLSGEPQMNVPSTTLDMLEAFRIENPGVAVVESFPGIEGALTGS